MRLARQVEVREGAVDMRGHDLARRADMGVVELVVAGDAEQGEADADLVFEDLEEAHHTLGASGTSTGSNSPGNIFNDTTRNWLPNQWAGWTVTITAGGRPA